MFKRKNFIRKLLMDGRIGHSTYLMFFLVFLNFILISYSYLIEGNPILEQFITDLWLFAIVFLIFYFPVSIIIGRWHTNTQISIEQDILRSEDPIFAKMFRTLLDVQTGKATEEEIKEFRSFMHEIEKKDIKEF
jgi:hypothetical protein